MEKQKGAIYKFVLLRTISHDGYENLSSDGHNDNVVISNNNVDNTQKKQKIVRMMNPSRLVLIFMIQVIG